MDAKALKRIIKEAVKEGFREVLLENQRINESIQTLNFTSSDVNRNPNISQKDMRAQMASKMGLIDSTPVQKFVPQPGKNPALSILDEFAKTVNPADLANFRNQ
jgi:hypothetical protein